MKYRRWMHRGKFWAGALLFVAYSALAVWVVIGAARGARLHRPWQVRLSDRGQRSIDSTRVAAVYRVRSGAPFSTLPVGSRFQIVWPDGSTETLQLVDPGASIGPQALRKTQITVPQKL